MIRRGFIDKPIWAWLMAAGACTGLLIYILGFYPGYMSQDAAFQYWQLRHHDYYSMTPIVMTLIWQLVDLIWPGPGGFFILLQVMFWSGLWLFCNALPLQRAWLRPVMLLGLGLLPFNLMIVPHLWKDVAMLVMLLWAVAFMLRAHRNPERLGLNRIVATLMATLAIAFRPDAVIPAAVLITGMWWLQPASSNLSAAMLADARIDPGRISNWRRFIRALFVCLICLSGLWLSVKSLESISQTKRQSLFPTVALWDLAHVSARIDQDLVPDFSYQSDQIQLDDVREHLVEWSNVPVLVHALRPGLWLPYSIAEHKQIRQRWLQMLVRHPGQYIAHRFEVFKELIRWRDAPNKPETVYQVRTIQSYRDNPEYRLNHSRLHNWLTGTLDLFLMSAIQKPWLYLLATVLGLLLILRPNQDHRATAAARIVWLSGLSHAGALVVMAPSAEIRYLLWMVNASLLGWLILATARWGERNH